MCTLGDKTEKKNAPKRFDRESDAQKTNRYDQTDSNYNDTAVTRSSPRAQSEFHSGKHSKRSVTETIGLSTFRNVANAVAQRFVCPVPITNTYLGIITCIFRDMK